MADAYTRGLQTRFLHYIDFPNPAPAFRRAITAFVRKKNIFAAQLRSLG
jgi:hypothetical protein